MDLLKIKRFKNFSLHPKASFESIITVEHQMKSSLPEDYKSFLLQHNGGEGEVGEEQYLVLWKIEELLMFNEGYSVDTFTPGLFLFGSDGSNMAYAFDLRKDVPTVVEIPFDSIDIEDAWDSSCTFLEFIRGFE